MNSLIPRNMIDTTIDMLSSFPSVMLRGARQVGKSTFAKQLVGKIGGGITNFDDFADFDLAKRDPIRFLRQYEDGLLVIDEAQRLPELTLAIKSEIDRNPRSGRFLLTGSSYITNLRKNPDSLAGRIINQNMYGFSQGELSGQKEDFLSRIVNGVDFRNYKSKLTKDDYAKKMFAGQYPKPLDFETNLKKKKSWYNSYVSNLLVRDIRDISVHLSSERLNEIFKIVAANQSGELVKDRIANKLSLSVDSVANCLDALESLNIIKRIPVYSPNLTNRAVSFKKSIVLDSGLCMHLNKLNNKNILNSNNLTSFGNHIEAFIISELFKQKEWSDIDYSIYHFRDSKGLEVDTIVELQDGSIVLFEIKATSTHKPENFRNIRRLAEKIGSRFRAGFVVSTAEDVKLAGENMWYIPASLLWEL
jgi:predicted AAA+ superfamily ATPase